MKDGKFYSASSLSLWDTKLRVSSAKWAKVSRTIKSAIKWQYVRQGRAVLHRAMHTTAALVPKYWHRLMIWSEFLMAYPLRLQQQERTQVRSEERRVGKEGRTEEWSELRQG